MTSKLARASLAIGLLFGSGCVASAQSPAEFYKGKTIQVLVGFGPGGEDDLWARTISRHLGNHIPGNPDHGASTCRAPAGCWSSTGSTTPRRRTAPWSA